VAGRYLIAAFGDAGHAFPAIALGRELVARGNDVLLETWSRWGEYAEAEGMRFAPAPDYRVGLRPSQLKPYQAAVRASQETRRVARDFDPDLVVVDILTVGGTLAAELEDRPWVSLIPHLFPIQAPGSPPYSTGARPPRTRAGRALWRPLHRLAEIGLRQGREQLNGARARVGLPPIDDLHGGLSRRLTLVATFPQLEVWRAIERWARVTGPLIWERPADEDARSAPPGDDPLVLIAPSTSQDPEHRLLRASLAGLAREPVRVLAATNGRPLPPDVRLPANARVVEWPSYRRTMPECAAVICHAGHGTLAQALSAGVPVVCSPAGGDMGENAARVARAGAGVSLPRRLATGGAVRLATRLVLGDDRFPAQAAEIARWSRSSPGPQTAADLLEGELQTPGAAPAHPDPMLPAGTLPRP
jgi:MGT family glycosyltransferase